MFKNRILLLSLCVLFIGSKAFAQPELRKQYAINSVEYLNQFRAKPKAFGKAIGLNLSKANPSKPLIADEILTKEAERKALEMAEKDYISHTDPNGYGMNYFVNKAGYALPSYWLNSKSNNQIESIGANSESGENFIDQLIIDKKVPGFGHRKHLLSMTDFYANNTRIGIGIAYNPKSKYKYYCCILIAPEPEK